MDTGAVPELLILAPAHERGMSELWQAASRIGSRFLTQVGQFALISC